MIIRAAIVNYVTLMQRLENISDNQLSSCSNLKTSQFYQSEKSSAYSPFREIMLRNLRSRPTWKRTPQLSQNRVQIHSPIKESSLMFQCFVLNKQQGLFRGIVVTMLNHLFERNCLFYHRPFNLLRVDVSLGFINVLPLLGLKKKKKHEVNQPMKL